MKITVREAKSEQPSLDEVREALRPMMSKDFMEWYADMLESKYSLKFEDDGMVSLYVPVYVGPRVDIYKMARKMLKSTESDLLSYVGASEEEDDSARCFTMYFKVKPQN